MCTSCFKLNGQEKLNPQKKTKLKKKASDISDKLFGAVTVASNAALADLCYHLEATQASSFPSLLKYLKADKIIFFAQRFY